MRTPDPVPPPALPALAPLLARAAALPRDSADRGALMACWMLARLAVLRLAEHAERPAADALRTRGEAARGWCDALALPTAARAPVARAAAALAGDAAPACATALDAVRGACARLLDAGSDAVLATLVARLRGAAPASPVRP